MNECSPNIVTGMPGEDTRMALFWWLFPGSVVCILILFVFQIAKKLSLEPLYWKKGSYEQIFQFIFTGRFHVLVQRERENSPVSTLFKPKA